MYNERNDQLFVKIDPDKDAVEFLLSDQPLEMIRANVVTKQEIRETIETGIQNEQELYAKTFILDGFSIIMNVFVYIDEYLRIVSKVEKVYL